MTAPALIIGIVVFLITFVIVLGVPPYDIGLIIIFWVLLRSSIIYIGTTAALITLNAFLPFVWGYALSASIAVIGIFLSHGMERRVEPSEHFRLALIVAGVTAFCVVAVLHYQGRSKSEPS
jgi:peptidoglycan/LPS O-acetylase OafA/YrhL